MRAGTKILKDKFGLVTFADGLVIRPFFGTIFQEGDVVNTQHVNGSTNAKVTLPKGSFLRGNCEYWSTTGMSEKDYLAKKTGRFKTFEGRLRDHYNFYYENNNCHQKSGIFNERFRAKHGAAVIDNRITKRKSRTPKAEAALI